jgi:hypothetical protein
MQKLEEIGDALGFPGVEIFPKQYQIGPEDVGNWINLPWFDHPNTDRFGWDLDGNEIKDLEAWLDYAEDRKITLKELNRIAVVEVQEVAARGPPCLQTLAERGIGEGMRNNVMFAIAVYAYHKFEEGERTRFCHEANALYFDPRMGDNEVDQVLNQIESNDGYRYGCQQAPIKDVCNRGLCLRRQWGVRLNGQTFNFGGLWQYVPVTMDEQELNDEATWRLQINLNGAQHMLDLKNVTDLRNYRNIDTMAANRRFILPPMDQNEYRDMINNRIENCDVVHVIEELSSVGELRTLIGKFLSLYGSNTAELAEILVGKVYHDIDAEQYLFQVDVFLNFLQAQRYTSYTRTELFKILKDRFGIDVVRKRIGGSKNPVRIWVAPDSLQIDDDHDDVNPEPEEVF